MPPSRTTFDSHRCCMMLFSGGDADDDVSGGLTTTTNDEGDDYDYEEKRDEGTAEEESSSVRRKAVMNTGTSIGWQGVGNMLFDEKLQRSGRVDLGVGSTRRYRDFRGNDIVPKVDPMVREWLVDKMPSLLVDSGGDDDLLEAYAEGLSDLGFNPRWSSLCELKYEELDFMKEVHRSYLYKEIMNDDCSWT